MAYFGNCGRRQRMSDHRTIVLQKSFCGMGLKFSEAWARRLNNDVWDHVATRQTHRRFWQRVCGSIERRLSLVSFFGENLAAAAFGTFATLSATIGSRTWLPRAAPHIAGPIHFSAQLFQHICGLSPTSQFSPSGGAGGNAPTCG